MKHPNYKGHADDLAIVYLEEDITDADFSPICLPHIEYAINNTNGEMVSFGEDEFGAIGKIKRLHMTSVTHDVCKQSNLQLRNAVNEDHFCAGTGDESSGPCFGDSGAGFMIKQGNKWFMQGILSESLRDSATNSCDTSNYAIYVDIYKYSSWIESKIGPKYETDEEENKTPKVKLCDDYQKDDYDLENSLNAKDQYWIVSIYELDEFGKF